MKEIFEFRMADENARLILKNDEGKRIGEDRDIVVFHWNPGDGRESLFREMDRQLRSKGDGFYFSWGVKRQYSKAELQSARYFKLMPSIWMGPAGEENGTEYDEQSACPVCHSGAKQVTPLFIPKSRLPSKRDIFRSIAGEVIISKKLTELIQTHHLTGVRLLPVCTRSKPDEPFDDWFQLAPDDSFFDCLAPSRTGNGPFDDDEEGEFKCGKCGKIGLNLLSEVFMSEPTAQGHTEPDFAWSRQHVGVRRGLLRPERVIVVSNRAWEIMKGANIKGATIEVAHVVS